MVTHRMIRYRRRLYKKLPRWVVDNDFELLASVFCLFGGIPLLLGKVDPRSVNRLLPDAFTIGWGFVLTAGGLLVLVAILHESQSKAKILPGWLRFKALGLSCLAYACYFYSICLLGVSVENSAVSVAITTAFGLICHIREMKIHDELEEFRSKLGLGRY